MITDAPSTDALTAEVAAFRSSLSGVLGGERLEPAAVDSGWVPDGPTLAELGVPSLLDPDEGAGYDGLPFAIAAVEQLALAIHPFPAHAVIPAGAVGPQLRAISNGIDPSTTALVSLRVGSSVSIAGDEATISGASRPVAGVEGLSHLLVHSPDHADHLFLVDLRDGAATARPDVSLDVARSHSSLRLDSAPASTVPAPAERLHRISRLLLAAETTAVTAAAVRRTVDYAAARRTFGHPIGQYQAVQHRLVDHTVAATQMGDLVRAATDALRSDVPEAGSRLLVAEAFCTQRAHEIISDCIQLTGGIGFTWEYGLHFTLRRASGNAHLVDGPRRARSELVDAHGW